MKITHNTTVHKMKISDEYIVLKPDKILVYGGKSAHDCTLRK